MFELDTEKFGNVKVEFGHAIPGLEIPEHLQDIKLFQNTYGTRCYIHYYNDESEPWTAGGRSFLHPLDVYDKERGRKIALARALTNLNATREQRRQFWNAYFYTQERNRAQAKLEKSQ